MLKRGQLIVDKLGSFVTEETYTILNLPNLAYSMLGK